MKNRLGYVSNSSSSSFIVSKDLTDVGISCLKLTLAQKNKINGFIAKEGTIVIPNMDTELYLTQYIYDDRKHNEIKKVDHVEYDEGQMNCEPRNPEFFNEYCGEFESIYLKKCHDNSEQMAINQFIKRYKKDLLPQEVLVTFEEDGVRLKYVY